MTRFLFAILKQKNLKDIDWTQVASDSILSQPISNGHAARMRYSRFRSHMLGLEPQRRNRPSPVAKSKVTKSKKTAPVKKDEPVKSDPGSAAETSSLHAIPKAESPTVKKEPCQTRDEALTQHDSSPAVSAPINESQVQFQSRLLTPASDTDPMATSQSYASSPTSDLLPPDAAAFDFASASQLAPDSQGIWPQAIQYHPLGHMYNPGPWAPSLYDPHHHHQVLHMQQHENSLAHHYHQQHQHQHQQTPAHLQLQPGHDLQPFYRTHDGHLAGITTQTTGIDPVAGSSDVKQED